MTQTALNASRRHPVPAGVLTWEPSERHVHGDLGGVTVVDSFRPVLVWEPDAPVPLYAFPQEDVRTDLLRPSDRAGDRPGAVAWFDLSVAGERREAIAWRYGGAGELDELIGFDWFRRRSPGLDHWFEEDEEVFVHPRDPYKRVDALPTSRHVVVSSGGEVLAESDNTVAVFETRLPTRWYLPVEDVRTDRLHLAPHTTRCPYKGIADAFTLAGADGSDIAWRYRDPLPAVEPIRDRIAFYSEQVDIQIRPAKDVSEE